MKRIRRLLSAAIALALCMTATLPLAACEEKEKHTHTFGEWAPSAGITDCNGGSFERICLECEHIEKRKGTENDHDWSAYGYNSLYHWSACSICGERKEEEAWHEDDGGGVCLVCNHLIPTESVTYELSLDETYAIVTGYDEAETNVVVIAPTYNNLPVKAIKASAFEDCKRLAQITIPESVTEIGANAFNGCERMMGIFLHSGITKIGDNAFSGCPELAIFCEAESAPTGWSESWHTDCFVLWGHKGESATPISVKASPIADAMLRQEDQDRAQILINPDLGDIKAPEGFSRLTRFDSKTTPPGEPWTKGNLWHHNWNQMSLNDYSEVWFAAKLVNAYWAFVSGTESVSTPWVYIHLKQTGMTEDNYFTLWSIEVSFGGQVYEKIENQTGRYVDDNRPNNSIARLLWDEGFGSPDKNAVLIYHLANGLPVTIYCTEVLGIKIGG